MLNSFSFCFIYKGKSRVFLPGKLYKSETHGPQSFMKKGLIISRRH